MEKSKKFMHKETGAVDTRDGWISSYDAEELAARGLTAKKCFAADLDKTLLEATEAKSTHKVVITLRIPEHEATAIKAAAAADNRSVNQWARLKLAEAAK